MFNDPFRLGDVKSATYTSNTVVNKGTAANTQKQVALNWSPVVPGSVVVKVTAKVGGAVTEYVDNGEGKLVQVPENGNVVRKTVMVENKDGVLEGTPGRVVCEVYEEGGSKVAETKGDVKYGKKDLDGEHTVVGVYFDTALTDGDTFEVSYVY